MRRTYSKKFKQGIYRPIHPEKYIGGRSYAIYRSSYELRFMKWADMHNNVIKWGSESVAIPYQSPIDGRVHRYYIDNVVLIKEGDTIGKYLIEIKPKSQTVQPISSGNKKPSTILYEQVMFATNMAKWNAAKAYCESKKWKFQILTETELGI
jgi:hypothetical protein